MAEFRIHVTVRRRGESISDSVEIKTEQCNSRDELYDNVISFVEEAIYQLEEGGTDDDSN